MASPQNLMSRLPAGLPPGSHGSHAQGLPPNLVSRLPAGLPRISLAPCLGLPRISRAACPQPPPQYLPSILPTHPPLRIWLPLPLTLPPVSQEHPAHGLPHLGALLASGCRSLGLPPPKLQSSEGSNCLRTDVRTRRYWIECFSLSSEMPRSTRKILRPQGSWPEGPWSFQCWGYGRHAFMLEI